MVAIVNPITCTTTNYLVPECVFTNTNYAFKEIFNLKTLSFTMDFTLYIRETKRSYHHIGVRIGNLYFGLKNYWDKTTVDFYITKNLDSVNTQFDPTSKTLVYKKSYPGKNLMLDLRIIYSKEENKIVVYNGQTPLTFIGSDKINFHSIEKVYFFGSSYDSPTQKVINFKYINDSNEIYLDGNIGIYCRTNGASAGVITVDFTRIINCKKIFINKVGSDSSKFYYSENNVNWTAFSNVSTTSGGQTYTFNGGKNIRYIKTDTLPNWNQFVVVTVIS